MNETPIKPDNRLAVAAWLSVFVLGAVFWILVWKWFFA